MIELFEKSGLFTIGSRLRWMSEMITREASEIYALYGIDIKPKWFPVLYMLFNGNDNSVTGIAKAIGQSHPSVSNIVKELKSEGIVSDAKDGDDRRATCVTLTEKGYSLQAGLQQVENDVRRAVESIERDAENKLWDAMTNWEQKLDEKSLLKRVMKEKENNNERQVDIVDYADEYFLTFKRLNIMWINSHWSLEAHDLEVLNDPESSIIAKGGHILVALVDGKPMGVVSLCKMDNPEYDFEIAKLAVDPEARGMGIGEKICRAAIMRAKELGAKKLFLESNTLLKPAIGLYRKLGFTELKEYHPAYERGDIQMELDIQ